ncbi:hypothetical protein [Aquitalea magnusonii]|uniref:Uncharacterized protein n=1 Tax=Aquitalea magnusonii TaxID=332411 RepID=A0A318JGM2_9NEIS|nr:hypothetical protein [Aquitalea magnusonii]PXX46263.1 hypothetical protein DFR38_109105 [Aquitalea magnusonii]
MSVARWCMVPVWMMAAVVQAAEPASKPVLHPGSWFELQSVDAYSGKEISHQREVFSGYRGLDYRFQVEDSTGRRYDMLRDGDYNLRLLDKKTGTVFSLDIFHWPLSSGQSHHLSYQLAGIPYEQDVTVGESETVTVPAGSFVAYPIRITGRWHHDGYSGPLAETDWYAPAIGHVVKQEYTDFSNKKNYRGNWVITQLQAYRLAGSAAP